MAQYNAEQLLTQRDRVRFHSVAVAGGACLRHRFVVFRLPLPMSSKAIPCGAVEIAAPSKQLDLNTIYNKDAHLQMYSGC